MVNHYAEDYKQVVAQMILVHSVVYRVQMMKIPEPTNAAVVVEVDCNIPVRQITFYVK